MSMIIEHKDSIIEAYKQSSFPPSKKIMRSTAYQEDEEASFLVKVRAIPKHTCLQACTSNKS